MKNLDEVLWVYHIPTQTLQRVAMIDFNNRVIDTYGIDEPIYNLPFDECEIVDYDSRSADLCNHAQDIQKLKNYGE